MRGKEEVLLMAIHVVLLLVVVEFVMLLFIPVCLSDLRTQPFPKKKAVGQAPHLPRGLSTYSASLGLGLAWRQNLWSEH